MNSQYICLEIMKQIERNNLVISPVLRRLPQKLQGVWNNHCCLPSAKTEKEQCWAGSIICVGAVVDEKAGSLSPV